VPQGDKIDSIVWGINRHNVVPSAPRDRCESSLMFLHQQKALGSTIKRLMEQIARFRGVPWIPRPVAGFRHCDCSGSAWGFSDASAYCEKCPRLPWITMFREPFERMKSAYMYCTAVGYRDKLCNMPDNTSRSPCDFGRRWGNYQFNQLLALPVADTRPRALALVKLLPCLGQRLPFPCVVLSNDAYCRRVLSMRCGLDNNRSELSQRLLRAVTDSLRSSFGAIGIASRFSDSLRLFAAYTQCNEFTALPLNRFILRNPSVKRSDPEMAKSIDEEFETCRAELLDRMRVDEHLYQEAVRVFEEQFKSLVGN